MAVIYADKQARSRSDSFRGITGLGAAMKAMTRDRNDIKCHFCGRVGHSKKSKCSLRVKQQQQIDGQQQPQQREEKQNNPRKQHQRNGGGGKGPACCSPHKITTERRRLPARRSRRADGSAHVAATGPLRIKGICSAYDLPEEDDQPERPPQRRRCIPRRQLPRSKATRRKPGRSAHY